MRSTSAPVKPYSACSSSTPSIDCCEWPSALYFLTSVRTTLSRSSLLQSISNGPEMLSMNPLLPSNTSGGPVTPRMARKAA